jgi:hypothetical protein
VTGTRPGVAFAAIVAFIAAFLAIDQWSDRRTQLLIGAVTWAALAYCLRHVSAAQRAQTLLVVAVATCAEMTGSIIWGVYTYRLENLPTFVPPGHGLVYLAGLALSRWAWRHERILVLVALIAVNTWAVVGLLGFPRRDVGGALGAVLLTAFLLRGRSAPLYAGVFLVVAAMEIYGTALGTWTWAATIPGTGVPNGNPPSGVASGYVWFDVVALALAPTLLRVARSGRTGLARARGRAPAVQAEG